MDYKEIQIFDKVDVDDARNLHCFKWAKLKYQQHYNKYELILKTLN